MPTSSAGSRLRAERLESLLSLAGVPADVARTAAPKVAARHLEPVRMAEELAVATGRGEQGVIVNGPLEERVVFLRTAGRDWAALNLAGAPLSGIDWPAAIRAGMSAERPDSDLSLVELDESAVHRLTRPVVRVVALYHKENFPLPRFPLGISDLARAIRAARTGQVRLTDMQMDIGIAEIVAQLDAERPDILGLSATFGQHDLLTEVLTRLEDWLTSATPPQLVFGGSLSALNADLLLRRYPDAVVARGAGEPTMIDVVEAWHGDRPLAQVRNIRYRGSELIQITRKVSNREYSEINPELDLLSATLDRHGVMQLESSRGCTHACSFCPREHKGIWAGYGAASLDTLLREIGPVYDEHPEIARKIFLVDEEYIGRDRHGEAVNRATEVAEALYHGGFRWETSSRVDQVYRPKEDRAWHIDRMRVWQSLLRNGLERCLFGVESGVDSILHRFNKHSTAEQNAYAIRILTALGVPIRCTYITFDQLMTMDELVASYRFQGRRDLTVRPAPELSVEELFDLITDEERVQGQLAGRPFYEHISYMLVSMECLLGSPFLKAVEKAGLAREILPSMGRRNAVFADQRIGALSDWSQRWVDHNFSLDYTLKSFEKVTVGAEHSAVRHTRRRLKASAYTLLGRMLWLTTGDDALLPEPDQAGGDFVERFGHDRITAGDPAAANEVLHRLVDYQLIELREALTAEIDLVSDALTGRRVAIMTEAWDRWRKRSDWSFINSPEQCVAE